MIRTYKAVRGNNVAAIYQYNANATNESCDASFFLLHYKFQQNQ